MICGPGEPYVLVTGCGSGLGHALVRALEGLSFPVAAFSRDDNSLTTLFPPPSPPASTWHFFADLGNFERMDSLLDTLLAAWGPPSLMVHNASVLHHRGPLWEEEARHVTETLRTNLEVPAFFVSRLVPAMIRAKRGGHVFISSTVGREPRANWGSYAISKAGVESLSANLALELPPPLFSFTLNPGPVATKMRRKAYPVTDPAVPRTPDSAAAVLTRFFVKLCTHDAGRALNGCKLNLNQLEEEEDV